MKNDNGKNIIIALLVVIIVILIALVVLFATNTISFNTDGNNQIPENNDNNQVQENDNNEDNGYNFGDSIVISKLSLVKDYSVEDVDLSRWHVLSDDGEYLTLMSDQSFAKIDVQGDNTLIKNARNMLENNGIDFGSNGEIRMLNENDLKDYFNCNLNTLKCNPTNSWLSDINSRLATITSVKQNGKVVSLTFDYSLDLTDTESGLVLGAWYPVIKVLKNSI